MNGDNTNYCDYFNKVEEIYEKTINILTTNYDINDPKKLLDELLQKYDEGSRRESEEAEKHIAFLCWLIHKAFMEIRLLTSLPYLPEGYMLYTGSHTSKLVSLADKKITWKYFRKYPEYFEVDVETDVLWIINFHKELHSYFVSCMEEAIRNKKISVLKVKRQIEKLSYEKGLYTQQQEWYEDGYAKYLKTKADI